MATNPPPSNPLASPAISKYMLASLPREADPQLRNAFDAIALAANACFLSMSFRFVGLSDDDKLESPSDATQLQPLPTNWNAGNGTYGFRYAHTQSSMEFLLRINRMGNKAVIMGMGMGDDKTCSFDITTRDYVSDGNLPATPLAEGRSEDESKRILVDVFISAGRLSDFGSSMKIKIIQKLAPGLNKVGYEEDETSTESSSSTRREREQQRDPAREFQQPRHNPLLEDRDPPARPHPLHDPLIQPPGPRRPLPEPIPGFEDEYETLQPPHRGYPGGAGFPRLGDRDLYPQGLGPRDPFYSGVGPGLGPMGGGGMHPTFDDPLFAGQGQRGQGFNPQAPPGSRYDPVGPDGERHPRGAGMGGRPPNPFGGFGGGNFI